MQTFMIVGLSSVLSSLILILVFGIIVLRSPKHGAEPITDEEYPLPAVLELSAMDQLLKRAANADWVKGHYKYEMSLNSVGRLDILLALLQLGRYAKRTEIAPEMSSSVFHRHVTRLQQTGLLVTRGELRGMHYSIHPDFVAPLTALLLVDDRVVA